MNIAQREGLKRRIESDLMLLVQESWSSDVRDRLLKILYKLESTSLEGYDD